MTNNTPQVVLIQDAAGFLDAIEKAHLPHGPRVLLIEKSLCIPNPITLPPHCALIGKNKQESKIAFIHADGIGLTANNRLSDLSIITRADKRAIYLHGNHADRGTLSITDIDTIGQVSLITRASTQCMTLSAKNLHVIACDATHHIEQPHKYGVNVRQGAFTLYNLNPETDSVIKANCQRITIGTPNGPVLGSGICISGFGDTGGRIELEELSTSAIYSHGLLPEGTADFIAAGLFISYGVDADVIINTGQVVTYGVNDMVLDSWGKVEDWWTEASLTSYGASGVGFVNFGHVTNFTANGPITTYGAGARGFNQYDGSLVNITLKSITTWGDGSVGIQISKPIQNITVTDRVETHGSVGNSLVKGVIVKLPADAISIKPGGQLGTLMVFGDLITHGDQVVTCRVDGGVINKTVVKGNILANGIGSTPIVGEIHRENVD